MATQADLDIARDFVGMDDPTDSELYTLIDSLGTPYLAAQRVLSRRHAEMLADSAAMSVTGFSYNNSANISAMEKKLEQLAGFTGSGVGGSTSSTLTRPDRRCR